MQKSILIIENEPDMLFVLEEAFKRDEYTVYSTRNSEEGIISFIKNSPKIIISEVIMPGMSGIEMVKTVREINKNVPIIFVSDNISVEDAVNGLSCGANDYIRKPFSVIEVVAKANAFLQFSMKEKQAELKIGKLSYDPVLRSLKGGPEEISLTGKEGAILEMLARNLNETVHTKDILSTIWGESDYFINRSLHVHITKIKKYLSSDPNVRIINERSVGYRLVATEKNVAN